jgi:hypothetical protein
VPGLQLFSCTQCGSASLSFREGILFCEYCQSEYLQSPPIPSRNDNQAAACQLCRQPGSWSCKACSSEMCEVHSHWLSQSIPVCLGQHLPEACLCGPCADAINKAAIGSANELQRLLTPEPVPRVIAPPVSIFIKTLAAICALSLFFTIRPFVLVVGLLSWSAFVLEEILQRSANGAWRRREQLRVSRRDAALTKAIQTINYFMSPAQRG